MDSVGIGELPGAAAYGDQGSDTVGNIARQIQLHLPTLRSLGCGRVANLDPGRVSDTSLTPVRHQSDTSLTPVRHQSDTSLTPVRPALGAVGRMAEASPGKDSVTGHWEMMGLVLDRAFPTFPHGFAPGIIAEFVRPAGRGVLGNQAASGTVIIDALGAEHMRTGALIVYTSADSVFQIAAHESVVPIGDLYRACAIAYDLVGEGLGVGRVIARPFIGEPGRF